MIHEDILNAAQLSLISKIKNIPKESYLAGGTALALHLGHRTSLDLDFYMKEHFDTELLLKALEDEFSKIQVERVDRDTLILEILGVSFSLFYYPYDLIDSLVPFRNIKLASTQDIAAMKMIAISMRGKRRDFVDTYYLLKKFGLKEIIKFTLKKYPAYQPLAILKGLIYFKDAEEEDLSRGIKIFDKEFSWEKAKKKIFEEVQKYHLSMIKV